MEKTQLITLFRDAAGSVRGTEAFGGYRCISRLCSQSFAIVFEAVGSYRAVSLQFLAIRVNCKRHLTQIWVMWERFIIQSLEFAFDFHCVTSFSCGCLKQISPLLFGDFWVSLGRHPGEDKDGICRF